MCLVNEKKRPNYTCETSETERNETFQWKMAVEMAEEGGKAGGGSFPRIWKTNRLLRARARGRDGGKTR